jgi:hypothetical protein
MPKWAWAGSDGMVMVVNGMNWCNEVNNEVNDGASTQLTTY